MKLLHFAAIYHTLYIIPDFVIGISLTSSWVFELINITQRLSRNCTTAYCGLHQLVNPRLD